MRIYLITALALIVSVSGCSKAERDKLKNEFEKSYNEAFLESYRASFIGGCMDSQEDPQRQAFCDCVAEDVLATFTPSELQKTSTVVEYVQKTAAERCSTSETLDGGN